MFDVQIRHIVARDKMYQYVSRRPEYQLMIGIHPLCLRPVLLNNTGVAPYALNWYGASLKTHPSTPKNIFLFPTQGRAAAI